VTLDGRTLACSAVPRILGGVELTGIGSDTTASTVCADHLVALGALPSPGADSDPAAADRLALRAPGSELNLAIGWLPPVAETVAQAMSGLMAVHGRDYGVPRRLGVDVASMAAGIVAVQGLLAGLIGRGRGLPIAGVETSALRAGLLFLAHHVAIATSDGEFPYRPGDSAGPPFRTADGHWFEIEVLSGDDWVLFWRRLGVVRADVVGAAWLPFVYRYVAGRCALPDALHEGTRSHTLAQVREAASALEIAVSPVRHPDPPQRLPPWTIRPHTVTARPGAAVRPVGGVMEPAIDGPLRGLRVVEATSRLQGPLAGLLLQMLGADVIKVEPPGGDFGRISPPLAGRTGAAYLAYNWGKRVVEVDYKRPGGRAELTDLIADADVFLHNWRPGRAESLGLDATDAARRNPALVYAHASGWGGADDAPSAIAGDFVVQAYAGCGTALNPPDEPPFPSRVTLVDVTGGLLACEGILAGLYLRDSNGRGCRVDTSLLTGAMMLRAAARPRWGVLDRPIETPDGYLAVSVDDTATRLRLCDACAVPASAPDDVVAARLRERQASEWEPALHDAGVPAAKVCTDLADLSADPRLAGLFVRAGEACWVPGPPWQFTT
jgi:CoA:oxalate CoA-transferase